METQAPAPRAPSRASRFEVEALAAFADALAPIARNPALPASVREAAGFAQMADGIVAALRDAIPAILAAEEAEDAAKTAAATLRRAVLPLMEMGATRVDTETHVLSLADLPRRVVVLDAKALPERFLVQPPPRPDERAIKAALEAGEAVPGAQMSNGGATVRLTPKRMK